jgi:hypothetical protein
MTVTAEAVHVRTAAATTHILACPSAAAQPPYRFHVSAGSCPGALPLHLPQQVHKLHSLYVCLSAHCPPSATVLRPSQGKLPGCPSALAAASSALKAYESRTAAAAPCRDVWRHTSTGETQHTCICGVQQRGGSRSTSRRRGKVRRGTASVAKARVLQGFKMQDVCPGHSNHKHQHSCTHPHFHGSWQLNNVHLNNMHQHTSLRTVLYIIHLTTGVGSFCRTHYDGC